MFRFANPTYLWLLLLIPILAAVYHIWAFKRSKRMARFGDKTLLRQLVPGYSKHRPLLKFYLMEVILTLLVVMIARPQMGTKISKDKREGIEAMIALDISNSMLAEDVAPSRLERSKRLVEDLLNHFTNDKIGLVVFAGDAFVQLPITADYISAKMFLDNISPSLIGSQGTDIAKAIELSQHKTASLAKPSSSLPTAKTMRAGQKRWLGKRRKQAFGSSFSALAQRQEHPFRWTTAAICRTRTDKP